MMRSAFALAAFAVSLAACDLEQVIDLEPPPYAPRLAIGSFPSPDSVLTVRVGRAVSSFEPRPETYGELLVEGARLAVLSENGDVLDSLVQLYDDQYGYEELGVYRAANGFVPVAGAAYRLRVSAPGLPPVEATTRVPDPVPFTARFEGLREEGEFSLRSARIAVVLPDPPGPQVYALRVVREEEYEGAVYQTLLPFQSVAPAFRDGFDALDRAVDVDLDGGETRSFRQALFRDNLFDGETRAFTLDVLLYGYEAGGNQGGALSVELAVMDAEYVRYQQTLSLQRNNADNPFAEPVRLYSNVEGGLGIFAGYATSSVVVDLD